MTLLDMVQRVLASIGSVNVETVSGSMEAEQIALIINRVYEEILSHRKWTFLNKKSNPKAKVNDYTFVLPDDLASLDTVFYKTKELQYLDYEEFIKLLNHRIDGNNPDTNSKGIYTDRAPFYYTSEAGINIITDAYDSTDLPDRLDFSIHYSRLPQNQLFGDDDTFELPQQFEPVLLNGVLSLTYRELKGDMGNADRFFNQYKRGLSTMRRWARRIEKTKPKYNSSIDYGRRGY